jgi:hypothetical protein
MYVLIIIIYIHDLLSRKSLGNNIKIGGKFSVATWCVCSRRTAWQGKA